MRGGEGGRASPRLSQMWTPALNPKTSHLPVTVSPGRSPLRGPRTSAGCSFTLCHRLKINKSSVNLKLVADVYQMTVLLSVFGWCGSNFPKE